VCVCVCVCVLLCISGFLCVCAWLGGGRCGAYLKCSYFLNVIRPVRVGDWFVIGVTGGLRTWDAK
jgi:hypothetical protein